MKPLPKIEPMQLVQRAKPFDHDDWYFEIKYDGFRSLAYIENGHCSLVSRKDSNYPQFQNLALAMPSDIKAENAIMDGELVVLDRTGKACFNDLMTGRGVVVFAAFDLLWLDGRDLRDQPLWNRKDLLGDHIKASSRILFVDHVEGKGKRFYDQICRKDLEGIVCKPMISPYRTIRGKTMWIKVKNPTYSQAEGRGELFSKRRS